MDRFQIRIDRIGLCAAFPGSGEPWQERRENDHIVFGENLQHKGWEFLPDLSEHAGQEKRKTIFLDGLKESLEKRMDDTDMGYQ